MVSVVVCSMKMDTVRGYYLEIAHRILMALLARVVAWAEGKEAPVNGYEWRDGHLLIECLQQFKTFLNLFLLAHVVHTTAEHLQI